jgi:succinate-semialdehyde dehydrogenase/glutarate-semialdehyde dehydrogenase
MTTEVRKTYRAAVDEAVKCSGVCRYYAENAHRFLGDEVIQTRASQSHVKYQPLGAILVVMPRNYPISG